MSENRPFYGKDGGKYRDYYEKEAADNRYDQQQKIIEETRRQNDLLEKQQRESQQQLLQQQMEQERANQLEQEKIELMKEQESRAKAQQNIAELNKQINSVFQQAQENMVQQIALCKEIGINYKNLSDFIDLISDNPKIKIENIHDIKEIERKLKETAKPEPPKYPERELNVDRQLQAIKKLEAENNKLSKGFFSRLANKEKIKSNIESIECIKEQIELNKADYINHIRPRLIEEYNKKLEEYNKITSKKSELIKDFTEFRKSHYNKKVELLFKRLELPIEKIEITEDRGTIEDFNNYFETKILEN